MITISRKKEYKDRKRSYKIYIDNMEVGSIDSGETKAFNVSAGEHVIVIKIDWASSNSISFSLANNQDASFEVSNSIVGWKNLIALFYISFWRNKYLMLKQTT